MEILIVHFGNQYETLSASSVIKGLSDKYPKNNIIWVARDPASLDVISCNNNIRECRLISDFEVKDTDRYDLMVNLEPDFTPSESNDNFNKKIGFMGDKFHEYEDVIVNHKKSKLNMFQIYYNLSGLKWRGQGYDSGYRPKTKTVKNRAGFCISDHNLSMYVDENIKLDKMKSWTIPFKKSFFKRADEVNKCSHVVTDDLLTMSIAISLKKYVYFLKKDQLNTRIEFFGKGEICTIPKRIFKCR